MKNSARCTNLLVQACVTVSKFANISKTSWQRWSDSGILLSGPILFLKNDIRIRSESCFGWNHTVRIQKLSESVLRCTVYIFAFCLFCLMRQNNFWSYFAFSWTQLVEVVTWQVWNACLAWLSKTSAIAQSHAWMMVVMVSGLGNS